MLVWLYCIGVTIHVTDILRIVKKVEVDMITTTDNARRLFEQKVGSYKHVTEGDILALVMLINKKIKEHQKDGNCSVSSMYLSKYIKMKKNTNGSIINCYLYANSHYFTRREAISFNTNGFIGFCGGLDQSNTQPFLDAFEDWCCENFNQRA